jgi:hypothetical protein
LVFSAATEKQGAGLIINPAPTFAVQGVTRDNGGSVLGACECHLFKKISSTDNLHISSTVSDATTGVYSLDAYDDDADDYFVVFYKDGSPPVGDASFDLTPV